MTTTIPVPVTPSAALAYCDEKLSNSDLTYYYMLLFVPRSVRPSLVALYAFWEEVREIPRECSDPEVARVKLAWWHEEIHRLYAGQPRHPVATALRPHVVRRELPATSFLESIEAVARHALAGGYATYDALVQHGTNARGNIELLGSRLTGEEIPSTAALGARLEIAQLLRETRADIHRGRSYLARDDMTRFGVAPQDLITDSAAANVVSLVKLHAERLRNDIETELQRIRPQEQPRIVHLMTAAEITSALLKRLAARPQELFGAHPTLPPLRQLWRAWRNARRAAGMSATR